MTTENATATAERCPTCDGTDFEGGDCASCGPVLCAKHHCGAPLIDDAHDADIGGHSFVSPKLKFRTWIIPQIPMEAFNVECPTAEAAEAMEEALTEFQNFMLEHSVMPDFSNAAGVEVWVPRLEEWEEYDPEDPDHQQ